MTSIKDVAQEAEVSVTTVSFVLNNKGNISAETRERVLSAVDRLGYTPSFQARNFREQRSRTIGYAWKVPPTAEEFSPMLTVFLREVMKQTEEQDCQLIIFESKDEQDLANYQQLVDSGRLDGMILADPKVNDGRVKYLHEKAFPFVMFGRTESRYDKEIFWVDVDGDIGIGLATEHLIEQGCQRIALLGWRVGNSTRDDRFRGYERTLQENNLPIMDDYLRLCRNRSDEGYEQTHALMQLPAPPDGIVAMSDQVAIGAIRYMNETRHFLPVTGFDDVPVGEYLSPSLTTLRQPLSQAAELLVEGLFDLIANNVPLNPNYLLTPELVIRESSLRLD